MKRVRAFGTLTICLSYWLCFVYLHVYSWRAIANLLDPLVKKNLDRFFGIQLSWSVANPIDCNHVGVRRKNGNEDHRPQSETALARRMGSCEFGLGFYLVKCTCRQQFLRMTKNGVWSSKWLLCMIRWTMNLHRNVNKGGKPWELPLDRTW